MPSVDAALLLVLEHVAPLGIERIPMLTALGRVLAEEIRSARDIPGFDNSAMDGYVVRAADVAAATEANPVKLAVTETVGAGTMPSRAISRGQAVRTMTGAPIAPGADAVVPVEHTRSNGEWVEIMAPAQPRAFVRLRGEDLREGELVMSAGKILSAADLGMLASLNRSMVDVWRKPRIAIVATGDELVDVDRIPTGSQVVKSSAYALAGGIIESGGEPVMLRVARDSAAEIRERLNEAMRFDVVISTGGVSVGQFDHVKVVLDELGMRTLFHGVDQRPGRPLKFGIVESRPVFGLPGNPVSTMVCFFLYIRPALLKIGGYSRLGLPRVQVICAEDIPLANNLTEFVRVRLERREGALYATPTGNQGSGILSSLSRADGLIIGPAKLSMLSAGTRATALLLNPHAANDEDAFFEERRLHSN